MSDRLFEHAVRDWLEDGTDRTPLAAIDAVLLAVKTTPQERDLRIPRRFTPMSSTLRLAAGIAIVAVLGVGALAYFGRGPGVGTPTTAPSPSSSANPDLLDVSTWTAFTSSRYGFSARYPATFEAVPSDFFWQIPNAAGNMFDGFRGGGAVKWLNGVSMLLPAGTTPGDWYDMYRRDVVEDDSPWEPETCFTPSEDWESTTVDGRAADLRVSCEAMEAYAFVDGRVYVFGAFGYDGVTPPTTEPGVTAELRDLFELWLTRITLDPALAIDPSPIPTLSST